MSDSSALSDLSSLTRPELERWFARQGEKPFRGRQVFRWLHARNAASFEEMTDLSRALRARLPELAWLSAPAILEERQAGDGTRKYRFGLRDGLQVEGVYMPEERRRTLCVSTQVGCAQGCRFCATGTMGLTRSLSAGEIAGQLEAVSRRLAAEGLARPVTNVVFMGMGEPLANLEAVAAAVDILLDDFGPKLSRRHVTVSTVGLVPQMEEFVHRVPAKLAVSLNASSDEVRDSIMPVNRRYPLAELMRCCRNLPEQHARVTFEYVLLGGVNDSLADARALVALLAGFPCKINLIPYNPCPGLPYERPEERRVVEFGDLLAERQLSVFVRKSRGVELGAACGQLLTQARRGTPGGCAPRSPRPDEPPSPG
ncbi:MAG TPA: 23S rRNA (adenine(2503)-C(2))-methyltransferase RlmN [Myxococcota bacterium]|nr:23S rRNA (adenine(2503)-C(2))-methyltransferase RlmN [Myxococcota bacterium]HRY96508.1 23S rRNA (adenine(2503)-C(2))-methyltransferase RlmN [Myxococcota bacterium]HSA24154.1 23S rRNA (adenine(2503)-C(2))-methyltransferase RlmN [Myxococcota bacterium]